ncbi:hypothetical protein PoB_003842300 [Plakobranchus ocellatus]|uniref:Uncharacterized protein n=1 Tax=Plakobranchus ocellatus TaxID=259542 RepID=A0AAV4AX54_9GAST|nr:hypothetical protein PoB_003842300 [Plakobranchus ocellatus]
MGLRTRQESGAGWSHVTKSHQSTTRVTKREASGRTRSSTRLLMVYYSGETLMQIPPARKWVSFPIFSCWTVCLLARLTGLPCHNRTPHTRHGRQFSPFPTRSALSARRQLALHHFPRVPLRMLADQ